jgi:putative lipase involved disintegration of autophagic bodies
MVSIGPLAALVSIPLLLPFVTFGSNGDLFSVKYTGLNPTCAAYTTSIPLQKFCHSCHRILTLPLSDKNPDCWEGSRKKKGEAA